MDTVPPRLDVFIVGDRGIMLLLIILIKNIIKEFVIRVFRIV